MTDKFGNSLQFASLVAHQLKAPISSAILMLQALLGEYAGDVTPKQRDMLERIVARCQDSLETAKRLLNIAKALEQPETLSGTVDLAAVAHQARLRYVEGAFQRRIELTVHVQADRTLTRGYEPAAVEALEALIHNALKYTPEHGRIRLTIADGPEPQSLQLTVEDSGIGIPAADRPRVFEPFFRTSAAQQSARPGTGLGLTFVQAVVQATGGHVAVDRSELGGAKFILTLPLAVETAPSVPGEDPMIKPMKVIIVGGVAAGPKVAAKVVRLMPDAEVTILDKGRLLSYAGCGLPYYISGAVHDEAQLISSPVGEVRDPVFFQNVKNVHVMNQTEALEIDRAHKRLRVRQRFADQDTWLDYNKLVLATGALPIVPAVPGIDLKNIHTLHGVADAENIRAMLEAGHARDVVILGGGLIGVEVTEALVRKGCRVTIVEKRKQILRILDWEMARLVERHLERQGVKVLTNTVVERFQGDQGKVNAVATDKGLLAADMVIVGVGVRPNTALAQQAGLDLGTTGAIAVNDYLQTSDPDIYAAGDCIETTDILTEKPVYVPLGSNANRQGRIAAVNLCGQSEAFPGVLRSMACKVLDYAVARTGLTEADARRSQFETISVLAPGPDREHFVPGAKLLMLKLVVDRRSRRLLGAQAIGPGNADKRIDVAALAIYNRMTVDQLANMDFCYAPPYSTVMDNLITAANIARNKLDGRLVGISPVELHEKMQQSDGLVLLDVRTPAEFQRRRLPHTTHIPLGALRERLHELPRDKEIITMCNYSLRGYEAQLVLRAAGFQNVRVLDGGLEMWPYDQL